MLEYSVTWGIWGGPTMNDNAEVIKLLTEIRDVIIEEGIGRKKIVEESLRLQRVAVRRQMMGLVVAVLIIVGAVLAVFVATRSDESRQEKNTQSTVGQKAQPPDIGPFWKGDGPDGPGRR
jgi:hypothetical protein